MKMGVKEDGKSKCLPVIGRIEGIPHVKTGRLPSGALSRET